MEDKYIVIIGDFIGSTSKKEFIPHEKLNQILDTVNKRYANCFVNDFETNTDVLLKWDLAYGDELKCVISKDFDMIPEMIRMIRTLFHPHKLRIAIGLGDIFEMNDNMNFLNGTAFKNARNAMEYLSQDSMRGRPRLYTYFLGFKNDSILNAMYALIDVIENRWSKYQWMRVTNTISDIIDAELYALLALGMEASPQAISTSLNLANYKNVDLTEKEIAKLLIEEGEENA